jgi:hypothetical protein
VDGDGAARRLHQGPEAVENGAGQRRSELVAAGGGGEAEVRGGVDAEAEAEEGGVVVVKRVEGEDRAGAEVVEQVRVEGRGEVAAAANVRPVLPRGDVASRAVDEEEAAGDDGLHGAVDVAAGFLKIQFKT